MLADVINELKKYAGRDIHLIYRGKQITSSRDQRFWRVACTHASNFSASAVLRLSPRQQSVLLLDIFSFANNVRFCTSRCSLIRYWVPVDY